MNIELKKLIQEYNQALANQSGKSEVLLANQITSLGYKLGYNTIDEIMEDYDEEI